MSGSSPPALHDADPIEEGARRRLLSAGQTVFDEGDAAAVLYLVRSGSVELVRRGAGVVHCVSRLGPGSLFGEQGTLVPGARRSRAVVAEDAELLEIETALFEQMCRERGDIALRVSRALAERTEALELRLASLADQNALRALVGTLLRLAHAGSEGARVDATLRLLGTESGLGLHDTWRTLQRLVEAKLVRLADDVLLVPDPDALAMRADEAGAPPR